MPKSLRLLWALVFVVMAGQVVAQEAPKLPPAATLIQNLSSGLGARWTQSAMKGESLPSGEQAVVDLEALLQQPGPKPQDVVQRDFIGKNIAPIKSALSKLKNLVYFRSIGPVYFADKGGQLTLLIAAISSGNVYDTSNTTSSSRASTVHPCGHPADPEAVGITSICRRAQDVRSDGYVWQQEFWVALRQRPAQRDPDCCRAGRVLKEIFRRRFKGGSAHRRCGFLFARPRRPWCTHSKTCLAVGSI